MPDMTLITRLIADSTQFTAGTNRARESNTALSGSVQSIIGQLQRQKTAFENAGRSTLDWIEADRKASQETKEHARALLAEVEAMNRLTATRKAMPTSTVVTDPMKTTFRADDPYGRKDAQAQADINARRAAGVSGDQWRAEDEAAKEHANRIRENNNRIRRDRLDEERAERERLDSFRNNSRQMAQARRQNRQDSIDDSNVQRQLDAKRGIVPSQPGGLGQGRKGQIAIELARGFEDASAGAAYGGFRGAVMGAANNLSQVGALMGPTGGIIAGVISTTAILGTTIASAYDSWELKSKRIKFELDEQKTGLTGVLHELNKLREMREFRLNLRPDIDIESLTRQQQQHQIARRSNTEEIDARQAALTAFRERAGLPADMTSDDIVAARRAKLQRHQTNVAPDWAPGSGAPVLRNAVGNIAHAEAVDDNTFNELREQERALANARKDGAMMTRQSTLIEEQRTGTERRAQAERRNSLAKAEEQIRKDYESMQALRRGGRGELTLREQITDQRARANEQNQKEKSRFESGQSWFKNRQEELLLGSMKTDKDRTAYAEQKKHQETLLQTAEAERIGVMTPKERAAIDLQSEQARDREIRKAKYGDLQADGRTGFGNQAAGTVGGTNAILQAIRYSQQSKDNSEQKRIGDISQEIANSLKDGITVKNLTPAAVVDF